MKGRWDPTPEIVKVVNEPRHTRNLFGPLSAIAGKELEVMERNAKGDCACFVLGRYLVEVDARDIVKP